MKRAATPKTYPEGYFSEPVRAWKSMAFVSHPIMNVDKATKRFQSDYARAQAHRSGGGFDANPIMQGART
jgi:hypothetical protein